MLPYFPARIIFQITSFLYLSEKLISYACKKKNFFFRRFIFYIVFICSVGISKFTAPGPKPFLHRINTFGERVDFYFKKVENVKN